MVAIRNSLPWPGLLVAAGTTAAVLEQPEEQQVSTVVEVCLFLISGPIGSLQVALKSSSKEIWLLCPG